MQTRIWLLIALATLTMVTGSSGGDATSRPAKLRLDTVLFTKSLPDGSKIEIHEMILPKGGFEHVLGAEAFKKLTEVMEYSATLIPANGGERPVIWSVIEECGVNSTGPGDTHVLDLGCEDGQFVLLVWSGGQLWAYYSDFNELPSSGLVSVPTDWTISPTPQPFNPNQTKANLEAGKDHYWKLHVVERDNQTGQVTDFEKEKDKWEFRVIGSVKLK